MKLKISAHGNDTLELSLKELFLLAIGRKLKVSALEVVKG